MAAKPKKKGSMDMDICCTTDTYWIDVFNRFCLADAGIELGQFMEDPYQCLRRIGTGERELLAILPVKGHA